MFVLKKQNRLLLVSILAATVSACGAGTDVSPPSTNDTPDMGAANEQSGVNSTNQTPDPAAPVVPVNPATTSTADTSEPINLGTIDLPEQTPSSGVTENSADNQEPPTTTAPTPDTNDSSAPGEQSPEIDINNIPDFSSQAPVTEQLPAAEAPVEQPPAQEPPAEQPPVPEPPVEEPPAEQPPAEEPPVEEPPVEEPPVEEPPVEEPPVEEPPVEEPPVEEPPVEEPPVEEPPVEEPPVEEPPVEEPPVEEPPVEEPPVEEPPVEEPPVEEPPVEGPPPSVGCSASASAIKASTLYLINQARMEARMCGSQSFQSAPPVIWNIKLQDAALIHSTDMAQHNFFSHTGSDGSSSAQRATTQEYNWNTVGENIAAGQVSTEEVVQGWIDSPGHCANLMNPNFEDVAVTCVEDSGADYDRYWTNALGREF